MKDLDSVKCEARLVNDLWFESQLNVGQKNDQKNDSLEENVYPLGGFLDGGDYAWLSQENRLIVFHTKTCELQSMWTFSTNISCVTSLLSLPGEIPLLLIGLDNAANRMRDSVGMLCIYDCSATRVLRAIRMPAGVEQVCILHNGKEWENYGKIPTNAIFREHSGLVYVALRNFQHLVIDLKRCDWENTSPCALCNESDPAEIKLSPLSQIFSQKNESKSDKHNAYNLMNQQIEKFIEFKRSYYESQVLPVDKFTTVCTSSRKIDCLIVGCLGRIIIWQNDGSVRWISSAQEDDSLITHLTLLEPIDDPKPFYYMCTVYQDVDNSNYSIIRMYSMAFEQKSHENGTNFYRYLEGDPRVRFEIQWDDNCKIISLQTIVRDSNADKVDFPSTQEEESLFLVGTVNRLMLFDLNQWYKEHMPYTLMECSNPNCIATTYQMRGHKVNSDKILNYYYVPSSLKQFQRYIDNQREELFYPNSLSIEWMELSTTQLIFWESRGVQAELLREIINAGSIILQQPTEAYQRCLSVGLIPFNTECTFDSKIITQRETLLSLCLEQRLITFLVKCAREWSDGSASYLFPTFLKWAVQRATSIKQVADRMCVSLFDHSRLDIDESEIRIIRFCCKQLEWLSNIMAKLPAESADLITQQLALKRVSTYLDVLLWCYDFGLLPEFAEQDYELEPLSSHISYPYSKLKKGYQEKREEARRKSSDNKKEECYLFIDEFINREFPNLKVQWEKEGESGSYPPPSLQSLLRMFLSEMDKSPIEEMNIKHQITTYLLIDLATYHESCPDVEQLIKYPSSFKLNSSLIKLTQSFYLLDHKDYVSFQDIMDKFVSNAVMKDWHHRLILRTLLRDNQHNIAMNYLRVRKPPLSSLEDEEILIDLTVKHGLVNTAFHYRPPSHYSQLLTCFFKACKAYGKLGEILHLNLNSEEEEAFMNFLDKNKCEEFRLLYNVQRCHYSKNQITTIQKDSQSTVMGIVNAYHATLPDIVKRFRACADKVELEGNNSRSYLKPLSHRVNRNKSRDICEILMEKTQEFNKRINGLNRNYVPFVSAPSSSLKSNHSNVNAYCVVYPEQKTNGIKRKHEKDLPSKDYAPLAKKQKLNSETVAAKSPENINNSNDALEMSMRTFTSTPLVKRCRTPFSLSRQARDATPQSILKIRQLIRHSSSFNNDSLQESRRSMSQEKSMRQIRFRFSYDENPVIHNEADFEEKSQKYLEQRPVQSRLEGSLLQSEIVQGPRPRPSLRSRHSTSSVTSDDLTTNSSMTASRQSSRYSLLDKTLYQTSILMQNTDENISRKLESLENAESNSSEEGINDDDVITPPIKRFSIAPEKTTYMSSFLSSNTDISDKNNDEDVVPAEYLTQNSEHLIDAGGETSMEKPEIEDEFEKSESHLSEKIVSDIKYPRKSSSREDLQEIEIVGKPTISPPTVFTFETLEFLGSSSEDENQSNMQEHEESFVSVSSSFEDDVFEETMDKMRTAASKPIATQSRQSMEEELNITDDDSIQIIEKDEEKDNDVQIAVPVKNRFLDVNITDDESNDSIIFSKRKVGRSLSEDIKVRNDEDLIRSIHMKITDKSRSVSKERSLGPVEEFSEMNESKILEEDIVELQAAEPQVTESIIVESNVSTSELVPKKSPVIKNSPFKNKSSIHKYEDDKKTENRWSRSVSKENSVERFIEEDIIEIAETPITRKLPSRKRSLALNSVPSNTTEEGQKEKMDDNEYKTFSRENSLEPIIQDERRLITRSPSRRKLSASIDVTGGKTDKQELKETDKDKEQEREETMPRSLSKEKISEPKESRIPKRRTKRAMSEIRDKEPTVEEESKKKLYTRKSNKTNEESKDIEDCKEEETKKTNNKKTYNKKPMASKSTKSHSEEFSKEEDKDKDAQKLNRKLSETNDIKEEKVKESSKKKTSKKQLSTTTSIISQSEESVKEEKEDKQKLSVKPVEAENLNEEKTKETNKKKTRKSVPRTTRSQSVDSHKEDEENIVNEDKVIKRNLRSRSQTPDTSVVTVRTRRSQSVTSDVSLEESLPAKTTTRSTRSRRAQSVSLDTVYETEPSDSTKKEETNKSTPRTRRAQSVSLEEDKVKSSLRRTRSSTSFKSSNESKRLTRSTVKLFSTEQTILEESLEETLNKTSKSNESKTKKPSNRRKRTISQISNQDDEEEVQFKFSLPDTDDNDVPVIDEEQLETEKFVLSPPHTRSRYHSKRK